MRLTCRWISAVLERYAPDLVVPFWFTVATVAIISRHRRRRHHRYVF